MENCQIRFYYCKTGVGFYLGFLYTKISRDHPIIILNVNHPMNPLKKLEITYPMYSLIKIRKKILK